MADVDNASDFRFECCAYTVQKFPERGIVRGFSKSRSCAFSLAKIVQINFERIRHSLNRRKF